MCRCAVQPWSSSSSSLCGNLGRPHTCSKCKRLAKNHPGRMGLSCTAYLLCTPLPPYSEPMETSNHFLPKKKYQDDPVTTTVGSKGINQGSEGGGRPVREDSHGGARPKTRSSKQVEVECQPRSLVGSRAYTRSPCSRLRLTVSCLVHL